MRESRWCDRVHRAQVPNKWKGAFYLLSHQIHNNLPRHHEFLLATLADNIRNFDIVKLRHNQDYLLRVMDFFA